MTHHKFWQRKKNLRGTCVISGFDVSFAASLVLALLFYCSFFLRKEKVVIVSKYFKGSFWSMAESYGWISKKILVVSIWIIIGIVFLLTGSEKEIWKVWRVGQFRHLIMSFGNSKSTQSFKKHMYILHSQSFCNLKKGITF